MAAAVVTSGRLLFEVHAGPFVSGELEVISFRGREDVSGLYSFDVRFAAPVADEGILEAAILARPACLLVNGAGEARRVHGIVGHVTYDGTGTRWRGENGHFYRLRLVPAVWLLKKRINTRIFQEQRVDAIVDKILGEAKIPRRWALTRKYPVRGYCVQYEESDYDFLRRILAEAGIFFYFEQPSAADALVTENAREAMVFIDSSEVYPALVNPMAGAVGAVAANAGAPSRGLPFRGAKEMAATEDHIHTFSASRAIKSQAVFLRDYDFQRPALDLSATVQGGETPGSVAVASPAQPAAASPPQGAPFDLRSLEVYLHHGEYDEPDVERREAELALEQLRTKVLVARGAGTCNEIAAGHRFRLEDHPLPPLNREYVVARVLHIGNVPQHHQARITTYENNFVCVPAQVALRPKRPRRVHKQVLETATVIGEDGQEITTDNYGRIKVRFHWERQDQCSCWLRVAQSWGGAGWGTQFIPRVGMEVLVSFLGGDQDRPVILGCLYNGEHPPSFSLPREKTRSGFRTQSSPKATGYNELSFEDQAGNEQIFVRAQRDLAFAVQNDHTTIIQRDQSLTVDRNQSAQIMGDRTDAVTGNSSSTVDGDAETKVKGLATYTAEQAARVDVGDELRLNVGSGYHENVGGGVIRTVGGDDTRKVKGNEITTIDKDLSLRVSGTYGVAIGTKTEKGDERGSMTLKVHGDASTDAAGAITFKAGTSFSISAGDCSFTLDADGIKIKLNDSVLELTKNDIYAASKKIHFFGDDEIAFRRDKAFLKINDKAEISADEVKLYSHGAAVELDTNASIDGTTLRLNCGKGQKTTAPVKQQDTTTSKVKPRLRIVMKDDAGVPYKGKPYTLTVDGTKIAEGTTGAEGMVDQEVPIGAEQGEILLRVDDRRTFHFPLHLGRLPPIEEVSGIKARLRHLGYYEGPIDDVVDRRTWAGLKLFQRDHGLEASGKLTSETRAKLNEMHGG